MSLFDGKKKKIGPLLGSPSVFQRNSDAPRKPPEFPSNPRVGTDHIAPGTNVTGNAALENLLSPPAKDVVPAIPLQRQIAFLLRHISLPQKELLQRSDQNCLLKELPLSTYFFLHRFEQFTPLEQAGIVAGLRPQSDPERSLSHDSLYLPSASEINRLSQLDQTARSRLFYKHGFCENGRIEPTARELIKETFRKGNYFPALILAMAVYYSGDKFAIMTARSCFKGAKPIVACLRQFLGIPIDDRLVEFVGDKQQNPHLAKVPSSSKKAEAIYHVIQAGKFETATLYDDSPDVYAGVRNRVASQVVMTAINPALTPEQALDRVVDGLRPTYSAFMQTGAGNAQREKDRLERRYRDWFERSDKSKKAEAALAHHLSRLQLPMFGSGTESRQEADEVRNSLRPTSPDFESIQIAGRGFWRSLCGANKDAQRQVRAIHVSKIDFDASWERLEAALEGAPAKTEGSSFQSTANVHFFDLDFTLLNLGNACEEVRVKDRPLSDPPIYSVPLSHIVGYGLTGADLIHSASKRHGIEPSRLYISYRQMENRELISEQLRPWQHEDGKEDRNHMWRAPQPNA